MTYWILDSAESVDDKNFLNLHIETIYKKYAEYKIILRNLKKNLQNLLK